MKKATLIFCFLLMAFFSFGQEAKEIFAKSRDKCQSINSGYYEMSYLKKFIIGAYTFDGPVVSVKLAKVK